MADGVEATGETQETGEAVQEPKQEITMEMVKKMIQSETDRVRTEYSRKLKETEAEKDTLLKERMSEKERATYELERQKKEVEEARRELANQKLQLERASVIGELEIPKSLAEYVTGETRDEIAARATQLMDAFKSEVAREVNRKLAGSTAKPESSDPTTSPSRGQLDDLGDWKKIFTMKPGPEKEKAIAERIEAATRMGVE